MITAMPTYVAFLRAINLGSTRKFGKAAVVAAVEGAGFTEVATHLNTGNVRFDTPMRSQAKIEAALEEAFAEAAGFDVPTVVLTPTELREIAEAAAELDHGGKHYVSLLKQKPTSAGLAKVNDSAKAGEQARVTGRAVHLLLGENYHEARLSNATVERHLGVATNRNLTVIRTLAEKWC